jgi:hypothetical protein
LSLLLVAPTGLGLALAREVARHGAQLALLARDGGGAQAVSCRRCDFGAQATIWPCDVQEAQDAERTISSIAERYGRIDVLVNNAGIMLVAPLEVMAKEDFRIASLRLSACSGGGSSSRLSFSTFGARRFPAGPSFVPGEIGIAELLRFTLPGSRPDLGLLAVFSESVK